MGQLEGLFLHEEVMLLALKDEEGTIGSAMYNYAIGGAVLAELLLNKRISIEKSKKKKFVNVINTEPLGDFLIDMSLEKMRNAKRRAKLEDWVYRIANTKDIKHITAGQLCKRGILKADEDKVLGVFTRKIYPEINPEPEKRIVERLRSAIFTDGYGVEPRTVILISIAHSADLLRMIFNKKKLKERKKRIEQVVNGDAAGEATKEAIEAMQAAVMVACIMPMIMTSVISTTTH